MLHYAESFMLITRYYNHTNSLNTYSYRAKASLGRPSKFSLPWRPTFEVGAAFWWNSSPDRLTLLVAVAGSRKALLNSPETGPSWPPDPTLTVLWLTDCQSLAVGGCSGSGRLALCSSISLVLSVLSLSIDYERC